MDRISLEFTTIRQHDPLNEPIDRCPMQALLAPMAVAALVGIRLVSIGWVITLAVLALRHACSHCVSPITWAMTGRCSLHGSGEVITPCPS